MIFRKYCIYKTENTLGIATVPTDDYHRSVKNTVAGGFISIDTDLAEITLSGKSEEFGRPSIQQIVEAISNNGYYLEKGDKDYTWIVIDHIGERVYVEKIPKRDSINDNTQNYLDDWQSYVGDYDKFEYDIMTKNGIIYENCYPNAGKFSKMFGERISIREEDVAEIRFSNSPKMYLDNPYSKFKCKIPIDLDSTDSFTKYAGSDEFKLISSFEHLFPERNSTPFVATTKIGRNDKCSCGSNKKYKNCCGK